METSELVRALAPLSTTLRKLYSHHNCELSFGNVRNVIVFSAFIHCCCYVIRSPVTIMDPQKIPSLCVCTHQKMRMYGSLNFLLTR